MMTMQLDNAWTLVAAMATILLGTRIHRVLPMLDRANIPPAVSAGWRTFGPLRRRFAPPGLRPEPALRGDFLLPLSLFRQLAA